MEVTALAQIITEEYLRLTKIKNQVDCSANGLHCCLIDFLLLLL